MMLFAPLDYQLLLMPLRFSLTFMMSVSPCYQLLLITLSVFSNVYDVVCVSQLSILDYPFGVL